jgi:hypothetical protein
MRFYGLFDKTLTDEEIKEQKLVRKLFWSAIIIFTIFMWFGTYKLEETVLYTLAFMMALIVAWSFF